MDHYLIKKRKKAALGFSQSGTIMPTITIYYSGTPGESHLVRGSRVYNLCQVTWVISELRVSTRNALAYLTSESLSGD